MLYPPWFYYVKKTREVASARDYTVDFDLILKIVKDHDPKNTPPAA